MPLLPDTPNTVNVHLYGTNQGTNWSNGIYLTGAGSLGSTTANLDTLCGAVATAWGTNIAPLCNTSVFLTHLTAADLTTRTSPFVTHSLVTPTAGSRGAANLPTQVAMCLSWNSARRFRGGHGRIYIPAGVAADITTGRLWNPAATEMLADANAAAAAFWTALNGLSLGAVALDLTVVSYYHQVPDPDNPGETISALRSAGDPVPTTGARVRTRVDTQRRRLGKETG